MRFDFMVGYISTKLSPRCGLILERMQPPSCQNLSNLILCCALNGFNPRLSLWPRGGRIFVECQDSEKDGAA